MKHGYTASGLVLRCSMMIWLGLTVAGCASTATRTAALSHDVRDPYEHWNRRVQSFNDALDDYLMKPVAHGYQWITPSFVDKGVTNFFSNVDDISVTLNDLLQFKFSQSGLDAGRFLVNTSAGVGGFLDVANLLSLPKHNEDFDQTLGYWGVSSGPYIVLPLVGPSTPRGFGGLIGDTATNPFTYVGGAPISSGVYALRLIDARADLLSASKIADEAAMDRYEFIRNAYFLQRNYLIYDGNPPYEDEFEDEDFKTDYELTPKK
ncbi:MAG: VacJ family lipoprotein [Methylococcaceae bacterium]|nr:MAG: VacJ family lipoprotein [Methylococcaceae bacterium]